MPNPSATKGHYVEVYVKGVPLDEVSVQVIFCHRGWFVNCKDLIGMKGPTDVKVSQVFRKNRGCEVITLTKSQVEQSGGKFDAKSDQWIEVAVAMVYCCSLPNLGSGDEGLKAKLAACQALLLPTMEVFARPPPVPVSVTETVDSKDPKVRIGSGDLKGKERQSELRVRADRTWAALRSNNIPFAQAHDQPLSQMDELTQDPFEFPASTVFLGR